MEFYDNEGDLDYAAAREALRGTRSITAEKMQRQYVAEITAAALLDIAASLSVLALEAAYAMPKALTLDEGGEMTEDGPRDFLVVGDLVHMVNDTEPGEVTKVGVDQGAAFADVVFAESGDSRRHWARDLVRLVGDEAEAEATERIAETIAELADSDVPLVGVATEAETPALLTDADEDEDGDEAVGGYELDDEDAIDADFDEFDEAAEDATAEPTAIADKIAAAAEKSRGKKRGGK